MVDLLVSEIVFQFEYFVSGSVLKNFVVKVSFLFRLFVLMNSLPNALFVIEIIHVQNRRTGQTLCSARV